MSYSNVWSTGYFDIFADIPVCLLGWLCPAILYGMNTSKIANGGCFGAYLTYCCCHCCIPCNAGATRRFMRTKYSLPPSPCDDTLAHLWCGCTQLSLCQEARDLNYRIATGAPVFMHAQYPQPNQAVNQTFNISQNQTNQNQATSPPPNPQ